MRAELAFFTVSVLINAAALYSVDHASTHYEKQLFLQQNKTIKKTPSGPIAFEYVESPKAPARKPASKTPRISDRDAIDQDLTREKSLAEGSPLVKTPGPSDQLTQKKGASAPPAVRASPQISPRAPLQGKSESGGMNVSKPPTNTDPIFQAYSPKAQAVLPTPPKPQTAASDRITTSEISKARSRGAQIYGITSFEATGSGMGVYMKNLKERIWLAWFPYLVTQYPRDFKTADAVISFKLDRNGEVKIVELAESKGSALFAAFCMESVQRAGPFGPLPQEILALIGKDELEIKFAFHYW